MFRRKLSDEEAEERFEDADSNKDDRITWKEQLMDSFGEEGEFDENDGEDELVRDLEFVDFILLLILNFANCLS